MNENGYWNKNENKKYYRAQANVDLEAIRHNILQIKESSNKDTKLMVIIKADAYGHGAVPVARAINSLGIDAYGVAIIEEAIELRNADITKPILILGYTPMEQFPDVVAYGVTQTIFQYATAEELSREALRQDKIATIHIKLDTGMSRIGFSDTSDSIKEIIKISKLPNIKIEGIFSHFSCAEEPDKIYSQVQLNKFLKFVELLEKENIIIPIKHMANTAGIINVPEASLNMIRCGIATYGIFPSEEVNKGNIRLQPAMELKSHVIYIKEVDAGIPVSYGATYVTSQKTRIATIPVGYADGYSRNLSNYGKVIINGQYAPIIGRICMDQFMVDVTDIQGVKQGDTVTLMGRDQDAYISVEELSEWSHSFPYELVCTVGKRIPRVYN